MPTPPSSIPLRPIRTEDAEAMIDLHLAVWEEAYADLMPPEVFAQRRARPRDKEIERRRAWAEDPRITTFVAEDAGELVGFVSSGPGRDEGEEGLEVMALYVRARLYGVGLGHRLLSTAIGERPAYLWVLDGNDRGVGFYRRHGFAFDGRTKLEPVGVEHRMVRTGTQPKG